MSKLLLSELTEIVDRRSSLLVIPDIDKLILSFNEKNNPSLIRIELYKKSLNKWNEKVPLIRMTTERITYEEHVFIDNFKEYAIGDIVDVKLVKLIPDKIISFNGLVRGYRRSWVYQDRILYSIINQSVRMNAMYDRPIYYEIMENKELDPLSCIGFVSKEESSRFYDQCLLDLLEYMDQIKKNFTYPNLPVDIFAGLSEKITDLKQELNDFYESKSYGAIYR